MFFYESEDVHFAETSPVSWVDISFMNSTSNSAPRSTKRRDPEPIEIGNALHYWIGPHRKAEWILSVL